MLQISGTRVPYVTLLRADYVPSSPAEVALRAAVIGPLQVSARWAPVIVARTSMRTKTLTHTTNARARTHRLAARVLTRLRSTGSGGLRDTVHDAPAPRDRPHRAARAGRQRGPAARAAATRASCCQR